MSLGIFTTIKISNGIPLFLDRHSKRLSNTAKALLVPLPPSDLKKQVTNYIVQKKLTNSALRITITKNGISIEDRPLPINYSSLSVITYPDKRNKKNKVYKTIDRTVNDQAKKQAEQQGAHDAIFVQSGFLIESTIANIFSVNKKGQLITPPIRNRGLNGITRQLIIEQTEILEEEIPQTITAPLVLVNCLRISKITHVDGRELEDGEALLQRIKILLNKVEQGVTRVGQLSNAKAHRAPAMK